MRFVTASGLLVLCLALLPWVAAEQERLWPSVYNASKTGLQHQLGRVFGKHDIDITVRCYARIDPNGVVNNTLCYSTDSEAQRLEGSLRGAGLSARLVPARVGRDAVTATVPYSLRVTRVNRELRASMWLHHGLNARDGDLDFSAPQIRGDWWPSHTMICDYEAGFYTVTVSAEGEPTRMDVWPDRLASCLPQLEEWVQSYSFFPAFRDGVPVEGTFTFFVPPVENPESNAWKRRNDRFFLRPPYHASAPWIFKIQEAPQSASEDGVVGHGAAHDDSQTDAGGQAP